jgi:uncharacterized lipoprotein YajG
MFLNRRKQGYRLLSDQSIVLQIGLLVIIVFLAGCGQEQPHQESKQPPATTFSAGPATATTSFALLMIPLFLHR